MSPSSPTPVPADPTVITGADVPQGEHLRLSVAGLVATIHLNRPAKLNAMTLDMWAGLPDVLARCERDESVRVLVLRGEPHFSVGADIGEFATLRSGPAGEQYNRVIDEAEKALAGFVKPTIAAVSGYCIGGGCELAVACDIRIARNDAKFAVTPSKLGLVYTHRSTKALVDLVGPAWAKQILFTGESIDAATALRIGLVNELADDLDARVGTLASTIATRAQLPLEGAKDIVERILVGLNEADEQVEVWYRRGYASADYEEGVAAFMEKRPPCFDPRWTPRAAAADANE